MAQHFTAAYMTAQQVAQRLAVGRTTVYEMVKQGLLEPPVKFGKSARFPLREVEALEQRVAAARSAHRANARRGAQAQAA